MPVEDDLASLLAGGGACPVVEPRTCPRYGYDVSLEVPLAPASAPLSAWVPGDRIDVEIRPGILDQIGGGACGVLSGRATREGTPFSDWSTLVQSENCVPVSEPGFNLSLLVSIVACACCARIRKGSASSLGRSSKRPAQRC